MYRICVVNWSNVTFTSWISFVLRYSCTYRSGVCWWSYSEQYNRFHFIAISLFQWPKIWEWDGYFSGVHLLQWCNSFSTGQSIKCISFRYRNCCCNIRHWSHCWWQNSVQCGGTHYCPSTAQSSSMFENSNINVMSLYFFDMACNSFPT